MEGDGDVDASFAQALLGWKLNRAGKLVPNTADSDNSASIALAAGVLDVLGVARGLESGVSDTAKGRPLELAVARALKEDLTRIAPTREFAVSERPQQITDFLQYRHLKKVDEIAKSSAELRVTLGTDYLIRPDVVVGLPGRSSDGSPFLHAVISCKWSIRSDRVQNIRHEYNQLIRHRRERLPHLMTVTAEPLPTRLASIARGTGEVDATYHIAFDSLAQAIKVLRVAERLSSEQSDAWDEVVALGRIRPYSELAETIARW